MTSQPVERVRSILLLLDILFIAANLRAPVTGIAPLLNVVRDASGLGTAGAGALTTLPLLAFAVASPFCVLLGREYGLERSLFIAVALVAAGVVLRSDGPVWALFAGTGVIGIGIAIANVLLPSLLKRDFPERTASLTSLYALVAGVVAAIASALAVPIAALPDSGWQWAFGSFVIVPVVAGIVWLPQLKDHSAPTSGTATPPHGGRVWRSALAWQVTLFFGLNSLVYYVTVTWLPTILINAGYMPTQAGSLHGMSQLATAVPGLFLSVLIERFRDQKALAAGTAAMTATALGGIVLAPGWAPLWVILFGIGAGATFILALAFVSLRATDMRQAATLSGMAQGVGYTIAAAAPPLGGMLHDTTGGWDVPLLVCMALCAAMAALGWCAGRSLQIT